MEVEADDREDDDGGTRTRDFERVVIAVGRMRIASLSTPKVQPATRESRARSHVHTNNDQRLPRTRMGKRKKSSRKPTGPRKKEPLGRYVLKERVGDCC